MNDPLVALEEAVACVRSAWAGGSEQMPGADVLGRVKLLAVNEALGAARRHLDAVHARVAAEIARESRPELGGDGLAKRAGFRTPATLIAATVGTSTGDAARLVAVGEATAPRMTLTGQTAPARHPFVAEALTASRIGVHAAAAIVSLLDRIGPRVAAAELDRAEQLLTEQAAGLATDQLAKVLLRAEAHLDPDGAEPREDELRTHRGLMFREDRTGALVIEGRFDPESGAPVKAAIESLVTGAIRRRAPGDSDIDSRTIAQLQADALTDICRHALGCGETSLPLATTTVVVRIDLEDLETGRGFGTIDGIAQPVSAGTVRRMAASGNIIACVLGGDSEILDWGRAKRLFTPAQRLALVERDGGCAFCGLPPGFTEGHHIRWWERDAGPTDLDNGILLCTRCHHRIHSDGWEIRIEGTGIQARVWFHPPAWLDPARTPRLGGRARFTYGLAS
ncbi:DUF222 domain-containing protein [uncultured Microbacterium sp.]|uniref:HNH endonuclease n=1 Tax=uncultured Microbacterium sp. TaxID=191216 RepID=UPI0035CA6FD6